MRTLNVLNDMTTIASSSGDGDLWLYRTIAANVCLG